MLCRVDCGYGAAYSTDDSHACSTYGSQTDLFVPEFGELDPQRQEEDEEKEDEEKQEAEQKRVARIKEHLRLRQQRETEKLAKDEEEASDAEARSELSTPEEDIPAEKLLKKKLRKVEKLLGDLLDDKGDEGRTTKEYKKLQRKRNQYAADLGVDLDGLAHAGDDHSIDNFSLDTFSTDGSQNDFFDHAEEDQSSRRALEEEERIEAERRGDERLEE